MSKITFKTKLYKYEDNDLNSLIILSKNEGIKLPSQGTSMVEGSINGFNFRVALEPDGKGNHWFIIDKKNTKLMGLDIGDSVILEFSPIKVWPEPKVPKDLEDALKSDSQAYNLWIDITPMARWDWIHWFESVKLEKTRMERPSKLCSMLKAGKRRPCCFNRTLITKPKNAEFYNKK